MQDPGGRECSRADPLPPPRQNQDGDENEVGNQMHGEREEGWPEAVPLLEDIESEQTAAAGPVAGEDRCPGDGGGAPIAEAGIDGELFRGRRPERLDPLRERGDRAEGGGNYGAARGESRQVSTLLP